MGIWNPQKNDQQNTKLETKSWATQTQQNTNYLQNTTQKINGWVEWTHINNDLQNTKLEIKGWAKQTQ